MTEFDRCPKCEHEVGEAVECPRCGVIVSKALEAAHAGPPTGPHTAPTATMQSSVGATARRGGSPLTTWLLFIALGAVALFAFGNAGDEVTGDGDEAAPSAEATRNSERAALPPAPRAPQRSPEPADDSWYDLEEETVTAVQMSEDTDSGQEFSTYDYAWLEGESGFRSGIEQAAREGRPVVMYFYTDWCGYCRQLENNLLEDATVEDYTKYLVKIRINPDKGQFQRQLAREYGIRGYPSLFVLPDLDSKPKRISQSRGGRLKSPSEFVDTLKRAARG